MSSIFSSIIFYVESKMNPLVMLHVPLQADLVSGLTHSCLWDFQRYLANVTNLRSLICERSVGSLSPFTVGLCRITSREIFSLKTFSFMVIYYSLISNVYATHYLSEDQFFRADTTEGSLHLWDCILEPVRSIMSPYWDLAEELLKIIFVGNYCIYDSVIRDYTYPFQN